VVGKGRKALTCVPCDLLALITGAGLPAPVRELKFAAPLRKWSADLAYPHAGLLIECDGGQFMAGGGRHNTDADYAAALSYRVLRFSPQQIERDPIGCVELIRRCLAL
jgi:very-short-patch-repair endonuclease